MKISSTVEAVPKCDKIKAGLLARGVLKRCRATNSPPESLNEGSCPMEWCSFGARRAFRTEPGMDQLAAGRLMSGSSLIVAIVSSVM
ncbi:hypothetical protein ELI46_16665 [Rhizobium ruizarguesonis]|nr:hypothetical protein ELI46_16665 [Rhizobium ruizarguesonis]